MLLSDWFTGKTKDYKLISRVTQSLWETHVLARIHRKSLKESKVIFV